MDLKSSEPFWLIKNGLLSSYPSLQNDENCDVLIIGGGITGSLIAHQCINDGYKTILVDKREIANGSSSATTSMLQYEIDIPLYQLIKMVGEDAAVASYKACSDAINTLEEITKEVKSNAGFRKKKSLYFAAFKKDIVWLKEEYNTRKKAGFPVRWITAENIEDKYQIKQSFGGIISSQGASVDAFRLVHELLNFNIKKGLKVYDKSEVVGVDIRSNLNIANFKNENTITAKKVIYCIGYEAASLIKEHFVNLLSTYAMVSEVDEQMTKGFKDLLIWNTAKPYIYMRTTDDHRMLMGGGDVNFRNPKKRDALIGKKSAALQKIFEKILPTFTFREDFSWAGTFGETKDGLPYIGEHQDFKNSYFVLGFGGNGISFSVTGMAMVSAWLKNEKYPLSEYFAFGR